MKVEGESRGQEREEGERTGEGLDSLQGRQKEAKGFMSREIR